MLIKNSNLNNFWNKIFKTAKDNFKDVMFLDKKTAWSNFEKSGEIADYLEFCKQKNIEEKDVFGEELKGKWDNNSRK